MAAGEQLAAAGHGGEKGVSVPEGSRREIRARTGISGAKVTHRCHWTEMLRSEVGWRREPAAARGGSTVVATCEEGERK